MDLKLLQDAIALIECGTLSRAAARRNVTQPAFSRRIRALEDWIGAPLLERRANRVVLSPDLLEAEADIRALLAQSEQLRRRIASPSGTALPMVLATQHALAAGVFPNVFRDFAGVRPEISWRLRTLNREDCISLFVQGEADLLLCYEARGFPPLPFDSSVEKRVWRGDTLIPVIGGSLRHLVDGEGRLSETAPVLSYPPGSHFGRLLEQSGLNEVFPINNAAGAQVESAFTVAMMELVTGGAGVAWVPHSMCRAKLSSGDVLSLARPYGAVPLDITLFALGTNRQAMDIISIV